MTLCTVVGTVVNTARHQVLDGRKLLICAPVDPVSGGRRSGRIVAIDTVQAGVGDVVLVADEGNAARLVLDDRAAAARTVIVAIVDRVTVTEVSHE